MENSLKITTPIIIIIIIMSVFLATFSGWLVTTKTYMDKSLISNEQIDINANIKNEVFPTISAKNMRIKQGTNFNIKDHVSATDNKDGDISSKIIFYGTVNTNVKGLYEIRCVVRNSYGLKTVKTIQVIVD